MFFINHSPKVVLNYLLLNCEELAIQELFVNIEHFEYFSLKVKTGRSNLNFVLVLFMLFRGKHCKMLHYVAIYVEMIDLLIV